MLKDLHCLISEEMYEQLRELAFNDRVSLAELIRKAVEDYLKGRGTK
jgi:predicted DNA-binding protein